MNGVLPDILKTQQRKVSELATKVRSKRVEAQIVKQRFRTWKRHFTESEAIAWAFAGGLLWATGRGRSKRQLTSSRSVLRLLNSGLLVWQFLRRVQNTRMGRHPGFSPFEPQSIPGPSPAQQPTGAAALPKN